MMRITERQERAIHSLHSNVSFHILIEILKEEKEFSMQGLLKAGITTVPVLQGRTQLLTELLSILES